ncbi:hypothetical protein NXC14_CH02136 [Rhizobium sp. NXC14]|nr:hypothetical protein NXC14_CH02136 [Rhizobium sp. NXC14]
MVANTDAAASAAKKRALHDISRSAHGMLATTVAAEVEQQRRQMTRFGTDRQHVSGLWNAAAR